MEAFILAFMICVFLFTFVCATYFMVERDLKRMALFLVLSVLNLGNSIIFLESYLKG